MCIRDSAKNSSMSKVSGSKNNSIKSAAGPIMDAVSKSTVMSSKNSSMSSMVKSYMQVADGSRVRRPSSGLRSNASMSLMPDGPHAKSCQSGRGSVTHGGARKQHVSARAATKPRGGAYNEQWLTKSGRSKARAVTGWAGMPKGRRFDVSRGKSG